MTGTKYKRIAVVWIGVSLAGLSAPRSLAQAPAQIPAQGIAGDADAPLSTARTAFLLKDFNRAEAETRTYLAAHPHSAAGMYLMGHILESKHDPRPSLSWFTKAAATASPSAEDLRIVAMDYVLLDSYPDALHWLSLSVELDPHNAEAWYDLGRARMMQGDFHGAQHPLEQALQLEPKLVKVENNLGVVYEGENSPARAAEAYKLAIAWQQSAPHPSEQPLLNYGKLLLTQNHSAQALPLLRSAVTIAPNDVKCNEEFARALDKQGSFPDAIQYMANAIHLQPESARLHFEMGQIYRHAGQQDKAKQELTLSQHLYGAKSSPDR